MFKDADAGISAATSAMPPPDGFTAAHAENQAALRYMMEHKPSLLSLWKLTTNDECEHCSFGGDVLTCSFCNLAWHNTTVCLRGAPLARSEDNEDHWACPTCWGHATRRHARGPKRKAAERGDEPVKSGVRKLKICKFLLLLRATPTLLVLRRLFKDRRPAQTRPIGGVGSVLLFLWSHRYVTSPPSHPFWPDDVTEFF